MNKIGSDISSSEDELLTGETNYSPIERRDFKNEKDDDRMSLSSLSSNDQKIEESKPDAPPLPPNPPLPPIPGVYSSYPQYGG